MYEKLKKRGTTLIIQQTKHSSVWQKQTTRVVWIHSGSGGLIN